MCSERVYSMFCFLLQELASRICEEFPHYSAKDQKFFVLNLAKRFGVDNNSVRLAAKSLTQHVSELNLLCHVLTRCIYMLDFHHLVFTPQMDGETFLKMVEKFKEAAVPVSQEIFKDIGKRPGGVNSLWTYAGLCW